jgi:two-component system sensor histidine kinase DesK
MRLLPRDPSQSWTPFAWLIYLGTLFVPPFYTHFSPLTWVATIGSVLIFLPLYFWGYWLSGWRLVGIAAITFGMGIALAPLNAFSYTYVIYAGGFIGRAGPPRFVFASLGVFTLALAIACAAMGLGWGFFGFGAVFMVLVGAINVHYAEVHRGQALLHAMRKENEKLAQIAERERIARDLHDLLGHSLSLITLKAELAGRLAASDPLRAAAEIHEVERISREAMREVRSAVAGYRSQGLSAELARARLALDAAGVRAEYFTVPVQLAPAVEDMLSLALREAVTNVVRHADAASCTISVDTADGLVRLEVRDDGRGGVRLGGTGTGLAAMRERIEGAGGTLELRSVRKGEAADELAGGTTLIARLPVGAAGAPVKASAASPRERVLDGFASQAAERRR